MIWICIGYYLNAEIQQACVGNQAQYRIQIYTWKQEAINAAKLHKAMVMHRTIWELRLILDGIENCINNYLQMNIAISLKKVCSTVSDTLEMKIQGTWLSGHISPTTIDLQD